MNGITAILDRNNVRNTYAAFVDILGFSAKIEHDFDEALEQFERLISVSGVVGEAIKNVSVRTISDSFLLVSDSFRDIVAAAQALQMQTLFSDYLVRGGISYGRHIESENPPDLLMISEAVSRSVAIEKTIRYPCVAVDPRIEIEDTWWAADNNLRRGLLYFGGHTIVNPCNMMWGQSAGTRVKNMLEENSKHRDKYEWFLELHQAIASPVPMVPPRFF